MCNYVFTIKKKPTGQEEFIEVSTKCRGTHCHESTLHHLPVKIENEISNSNDTESSSINQVTNYSPKHRPLATSQSNTSTSNDRNVMAKTADRVCLIKQKKKLNGHQNNSSTPGRSNLNSNQRADDDGFTVLDRALVNQISMQIGTKIMNKLEQINLKVNQISDRMFDLEKKFDNMEGVFESIGF